MNPKTILFIFVGLFLVAPLSPFMVAHVQGAASTYTDVTVSQTKAMIDAKPLLVLLDVRNQSEYDAGHIRNAKLIPVWQLASRLNELNLTDEILVYCQAGGRSANASQVLVNNNFTRVYNMLGGILQWVAAGYTVYAKYPSLQEAVNNATDGSTIYVSSGVYNGHLSVDRPVTLVGEDKSTTMINGTATVLHVGADNVSVSDFTIEYVGCACFGYSAVNVTNGQNINVTNNIIGSDDYGVRVIGATEVIIANNNFTHSGDAFVVVLDSSRVSVLGNYVTAFDGIETDNSTESTFSGNTVFSSRGGGIFVSRCYEDTFSNNTISCINSVGISISTSYNNTFFDNTIFSSDTYGLFFWYSDNNTFFHNSLLGSSSRLSNFGDSTNLWDNGFEGNYWSSYTGVDTNLDGIGDTPYVLDSLNIDNHPLMGRFSSFNTSLDYDVDIVSNSTVSEFKYLGPNRTIELRVSNATANQTVGFCRVSIPHSLIDPYNGSISVVIDNGLTPVLFLNSTLYDNGTHRWIYFTYSHSTHEVVIVPEFPILLVPSLFMMATLTAAVAHRRRRSRSS